MDRDKVLAEALIKNPHGAKDEINSEAADVMMVIFHLGRMKDCDGFLNIKTHTLTGSGFDLAMDLYEEGWRIELDNIFNILNDIFEGQNNAMLSTLIYTTQSMSITKMKGIINKK